MKMSKNQQKFDFRAVIKRCILAESVWLVGLIDATKLTLLAHNFKLIS